jgi:hypothetical protein
MLPKKSLALLALTCGLIWAAPATAGPGHRGGDRWDGRGGGDVPSRVSSRLARAERALERAEDKVDDGDAAGAAASLRSVRKNLAAALKSANRRVAAGADNGPDAIGAVFDAQHNTVETTAALFDGADGDVVDALADALKASLDGRDEGVAQVAALSADQREDYESVLEQVDEDIGDEIEQIDEALADDTLTDEARAALEQAKTQLEATRTSVRALLPAGSTEEGTTGVAAGDDEECDERRGEGGRRGGRRGGPQEGQAV